MRARQSAIIETAHNVQAFLDANAAIVGPNIASARHNLDDAVEQLTTMAATQTGGVIASKGATARQKALRTTLRNNFMKPVSTVAKLMIPDVPEIVALDIKTKGLNSTQLAASAHAMADAAEKYAEVFTKHGLPAEFATNLRAAADAVTTAVSGKQQTQAVTSGAVQGMAAQETRVRSLLKLINALVVPKLGTNAVLLAHWKSARAISATTPIPSVPSTVTSAVEAAPAASTPATATSTPATAAPAPATQGS